VFEVFEEAHRNPSLIERGALNFVVVGAGATGVEVSGALADLVNRVLPGQFRSNCIEAARIYVIDPANVVLAPFSERAQSYAGKVLQDKGVQLELGVSVTEVKPDRVVLSDGREIMTRTVVWAGGITAQAVANTAGLPQGHGGRLVVEPDLSVRGFPNVYALGDVAETPGADGRPLPQLGSVALQAGYAAARNIIADIDGRKRTTFRYHDKGIMAMIGRSAAIAEVGHKRRELHGAAAWSAWLGVHLYLLTGFRERMTALRSWLWDYFTKSRAPALIDRADVARIDWSEPPTPVHNEVNA
jgi:NADH dehydrogenase